MLTSPSATDGKIGPSTRTALMPSSIDSPPESPAKPLWLLAAAKRAVDALVPSFQRGLALERDPSRAAFAAPESRALMAEFLTRGGQTESGERRLAELVGERSASDW